MLTAVSHIVLAIRNAKEANAYDERGRLITWRAERLGGYVLTVGVVAGLVLAMLELRTFYIAHALLLAWVLAEITGQCRQGRAVPAWRLTVPKPTRVTNRIRTLRSDTGEMTQGELADRIDVTRQTVNAIEQGKLEDVFQYADR